MKKMTLITFLITHISGSFLYAMDNGQFIQFLNKETNLPNQKNITTNTGASITYAYSSRPFAVQMRFEKNSFKLNEVLYSTNYLKFFHTLDQMAKSIKNSLVDGQQDATTFKSYIETQLESDSITRKKTKLYDIGSKVFLGTAIGSLAIAWIYCAVKVFKDIKH